MLCLQNAWNCQEVFLIILSLFSNLKMMSALFGHEMFLVCKCETFTNCKEVKHIMVMIIAIIYIFFILWDIWATVENYFPKILSEHPTSHNELSRNFTRQWLQFICYTFDAKMKNEWNKNWIKLTAGILLIYTSDKIFW